MVGVKIPRVGVKITRGSLTPGGQAAQGVKINCYTGTASWYDHGNYCIPLQSVMLYFTLPFSLITQITGISLTLGGGGGAIQK